MKRKNISAIIVAAGKGIRLGKAVPKAFVLLRGKPLLAYSIKTLAEHPAIREVIVVVSNEMIGRALSAIKKIKCKKPVTLTNGGKERWNSVFNGVSAVDNKTEWVMIHDAARPFVTRQVIDAVIKKTDTHRAVITATPVDDTIRKFRGDTARGTVDRATLVRVGTPQMFHKKTLLAVFKKANRMKQVPTDEAMLVESTGIPVGIAPGDPLNFKITSPCDLFMAEAILPRLNRS